MYDALIPLSRNDHDRVLADEREYDGTGDRFIVPIVADEAPNVARRYPIAWRDGPNGPEPCVLRALVPEARMFRAEDEAARPLLVDAYPLAPVETDHGETIALVDDRAPRAGARTEPVFSSPGVPGKAAARRLEALRRFTAGSAKTRAWSSALADLGLLEPWVVDLKLRGRSVTLSGLSILVRDEVRRRRLTAVVDRFGSEAYEFLVLHEISLFHMQTLAEAFVSGIANREADVS